MNARTKVDDEFVRGQSNALLRNLHTLLSRMISSYVAKHDKFQVLRTRSLPSTLRASSFVRDLADRILLNLSSSVTGFRFGRD